MEIGRIRKINCLIYIMISIFVFSVFISDTKAEAFANNKYQKVRVGFFQFDGYHEMNQKGMKSGYGYDFLQMLGGYTNFDFEYVGYNKSWDDMLSMLKSNQIDMVTCAQRTGKRADSFAFSQNPIGYSAVILSTTTTQQKIKPGNYAAYNGMKVGIIEGSIQAEQLKEFAKKHKFTYKPVYFKSLSEMKDALKKNKKVDAIATSSIRSIENERILERFNETPFYVAVRKSDSKLLTQINKAMNELDTCNPTWKSILGEKYYTTNQGSHSFNKEEREYIEALKASTGMIHVLINPNLKPYSYFEGKEAKGILVDYFEKICKHSEATPSYIPVKNSEEYYKLVKNKVADVVLAPNIGFYEAEKDGYHLTPSFMNAPISIITQNGKKDYINAKIAVTSGMTSLINTAYSNLKSNQIVYCNSVEECIDAVKKEKVNGALMYTFSAYEYLNSDWGNELQAMDVSMNNAGFAIAVANDRDINLYSVMCKGINSIDKSEVQSLLAKQSLTIQKEPEPILIHIYHNPVLFVTIVIIIVAIIIIFLVMKYQKLNAEQKRKRKKAEFEAKHDLLTGLLNRKAYEKIITKLNEQNKPIAYMMADIDHFKEINDDYGHDIGDKILARFSNILKNFVKENDYAFRFGGDEFVVLISDFEMDQLDFLIQRIHEIAEQLAVKEGNLPGAEISIGICVSEEKINNDLYRRADEALYHTKKNGRSGCTIMDCDGNILLENHENSKTDVLMPKNQVLHKNYMGLWRIEMPNGGLSCMYCDEAMLRLIAMDNNATPEECYTQWFQNIDKEYVPLVMETIEKIFETGHAEVNYIWHSPEYGEMNIRCGGTYDPEYKKGRCIYGFYQNITNTTIFEKKKED